MKYQESQRILEMIQAAQKIALNCHHHPDSDTVASATVLAKVIQGMGKEVVILCPDQVPSDLLFIDGADRIVTKAFEDVSFSDFDLLIMCDTSTWKRVFISQTFTPPTIPVVVIDNHVTNEKYGTLNLLDFETSSVSEMMYSILTDWGVSIDSSIATALMAGIVGDTGSFQYEIHADTFAIAHALKDAGADMKNIDLNLFDTKPLALIQFWGKTIDKLTIEDNFAYAAFSFDEYNEFVHINGTRESAVGLIIRKVENTDFGFILTEEAPNTCSISFRSRTGTDVAQMAVELGGGGHKGASGVYMQQVSFAEALEKTLTVCRKYKKIN